MQSKNTLYKQQIFCNSIKLKIILYMLWAVYLLLFYNLLVSTEIFCKN